MSIIKQANLILISIYIMMVMSLDCFTPFALAQDKILAVVNDEIITKRDLDDFMNFMHMQLSAQYKEDEVQKKIDSMKKDLLERLIEDRLILQAARKEKIRIDKNRIESKIVSIRQRYPSDSEFQKALRMQGTAQSDLERQLEEQLLIFSVVDLKVKSKIIINPSEVSSYYESHLQVFLEPERRQVRALVIEDLDKAKIILDALNNKGENFDKVIKSFSLAVRELGLVKKGALKKDIEDVIFNLGLNGVSNLVEANGSYYIFHIEQIFPARQPTLTEASEGIYNLLLEKKMQQELVNWLDELKQESYISIKKD